MIGSLCHVGHKSSLSQCCFQTNHNQIKTINRTALLTVISACLFALVLYTESIIFGHISSHSPILQLGKQKQLGIVVITNGEDPMYRKLSQYYPGATSQTKPVYDYESYVGTISEDVKSFVYQETIDTDAMKIIGTTKAHIQALVNLMESATTRTALIMEDGTIFAPGSNIDVTMKNTMQVLQDVDSGTLPYDIVYLGWCRWKHTKDYSGWDNFEFGPYYSNTTLEYETVTRSSSNLRNKEGLPPPLYCLHAYAVTRSAASILVRYHHTFSNLDEQIPELINNGKIRAARLKRPIFYQDWQFEEGMSNYGNMAAQRSMLEQKYERFSEWYWWLPALMIREHMIRPHTVPRISQIKQFLMNKISRTAECVAIVESIEDYTSLNAKGWQLKDQCGLNARL